MPALRKPYHAAEFAAELISHRTVFESADLHPHAATIDAAHLNSFGAA